MTEPIPPHDRIRDEAEQICIQDSRGLRVAGLAPINDSEFAVILEMPDGFPSDIRSLETISIRLTAIDGIREVLISIASVGDPPHSASG